MERGWRGQRPRLQRNGSRARARREEHRQARAARRKKAPWTMREKPCGEPRLQPLVRIHRPSGAGPERRRAGPAPRGARTRRKEISASRRAPSASGGAVGEGLVWCRAPPFTPIRAMRRRDPAGGPAARSPILPRAVSGCGGWAFRPPRNRHCPRGDRSGGGSRRGSLRRPARKRRREAQRDQDRIRRPAARSWPSSRLIASGPPHAVRPRFDMSTKMTLELSATSLIT